MADTLAPSQPIRRRERDAVVQSLRAGVVPKLGQHHIQVGRVNEVAALVTDIDRLADDGSSIRFAIGEYGSGKSFFLNLVRSIALERKLVTVDADLAPDRRLYSTGGSWQTCPFDPGPTGEPCPRSLSASSTIAFELPQQWESPRGRHARSARLPRGTEGRLRFCSSDRCILAGTRQR